MKWKFKFEDLLFRQINNLEDLLFRQVNTLQIYINKQVKSNNDTQTRRQMPENNTTSADRNSAKCKYAFIAGDSMTSVLSSNKMSDSSVKVNIKTHSGGRVRIIKNTFIAMNETDSHEIKDKDVVLLHVGTSNISDVDSSQYICEELKYTIHTVKTIHSKCKIIISSILPRRNDKLVNTIISEANVRFRNMCEEDGNH